MINFEDAVYKDKVLYLDTYEKELAEKEQRVTKHKVKEITFRFINPLADGKCGYYLMHIVANVLNKNNWDLDYYNQYFREMNRFQMNEYDAAKFLKDYGANLLCITKLYAPEVSLFIDKFKPWVILYNDQSHWKLLTYQSVIGSQAVYYPIFTTKLVQKIFDINTDELKSTDLKTATLDKSQTPLKAMPPPEIPRIRDDELTSATYDLLEAKITTMTKSRTLTELEIMNIIYRHTMIKRHENNPDDQTSEQLKSFIHEKFSNMVRTKQHNPETTAMIIAWLTNPSPTIAALCVALDCFRFITVDEHDKTYSESRYTCSSENVLCILMTTDRELIINVAFDIADGRYHVRIFHKPSEVNDLIARSGLQPNLRRPSGSSRRSSRIHEEDRKISTSASRRRTRQIDDDAIFAKELQRQEFINGLKKGAKEAVNAVAVQDEQEWKKLHWNKHRIPHRRASAARKSISRRMNALEEEKLLPPDKARLKEKYTRELQEEEARALARKKQEEADQGFADELVLEEAQTYRNMRRRRGKGETETTPTRIRENEAAVTERIAKKMNKSPSGK